LSALNVATGIQQIFPTFLMRRNLEKAKPLNARLRQIVLEMEIKQDGGNNSSNVGGWHSSPDLMEWDYDEIRDLNRVVLETGADLACSMMPGSYEGDCQIKYYGGCWANLLRHGGYNRIHNHPGAVFSGCYYVSCGEPVNNPMYNGWIEFQDPRPGNIYGGKERVEPEEGLLLMFPSWLNHFVNPFMGGGERISIAFNLEATMFPHGYKPPRGVST
jgi:uncharacterized protein (TIGR02466 family)